MKASIRLMILYSLFGGVSARHNNPPDGPRQDFICSGWWRDSYDPSLQAGFIPLTMIIRAGKFMELLGKNSWDAAATSILTRFLTSFERMASLDRSVPDV